MPCSAEVGDLLEALAACEDLRNYGHTFVTLVSDYHNMVGKPGVRAAGPECVPQLLNQ